MKKVNTLVIGGGPGGYVAAIKLAKLGVQTTLVEKHKLGGECLHWGCIPSKALIHAASVLHKARKAKDIGIECDNLRVDAGKLQAWKSNLLETLHRGIQGLCKGYGVETIAGEAKFTGSNTAEVNGETLEFDHAIIATGSKPIEIPGFSFDAVNVIGAKEALELKEVPAKLVVIGGGAIGLEMACFYAKLGSEVAVVEMMPQILPGMDPEAAQVVSKSLVKLGIKAFTNARAKSWSGAEGSLKVTLETAEGPVELEASKILLSVGKKPFTQGLGLESAGVALDAKGWIGADENGRTSNSKIFAIGDAAGGLLLAHKASYQGIQAAEIIAGKRAQAERASIPLAVFTDPEVASVGLTEAEAKAKGMDVLVGKFPFTALGRALAAREMEGFAKVIAEKGTERILGATIVGPSASDLISEACLAVKLGATLHDVAFTMHPHPTLPEAFLESSEAALGQAIHILQKPPVKIATA